jgi:hypothetical protein
MYMSVSRRTLLALVPLALAGTTSAAFAATMSFNVPLTGAQQVPPVQTTGSGTAHVTYNTATREVTWSVRYSKLSSAPTMAHFHNGAEGANGPVVVWLTTKGKAPMDPFKGHATLTEDQAKQFLAGDWYINLHTKDHPAGEIRGQVMPPKH